MENLPLYLPLLFGAITLITVFIFYRASHRSKIVMLFFVCLLGVQTLVGLTGFFTTTNVLPPPFLLLVVPPVLLIVVLFATVKGRRFIDGLDPKILTLLHTVRVPVELVLLALFTYKTIPQVMTFEGRNLDILSGLTAPFIWYFGFVRKKLSARVMISWNVICLVLLVNIVTHAILAAPFPFQQIAFDQPNIAVLYFPYIWLPGCVVPLVLFSHLVTLRHLAKQLPVADKQGSVELARNKMVA